MRRFIRLILISSLFLTTTIQVLGQISLKPPSQKFVLRFFGDQFVQVPSTTPFNLSGSFTMECWVYLESASPNSIVMGKATSSPYSDPNFHYVLGFADSTRPRFIQSTGQPGSAQTAMASTFIPLRTWTHLAATLSGNTLRLYVNGDSVGTATSFGSPQPDNTVPFALGATAYLGGTADGFSGSMSQARVWSRALSSSELKTNATKYLTGNETDLMASWPLNEGGGQFARDQKQNYNLLLGVSANNRGKDPHWVRRSVLENGPYFTVQEFRDTSLILNTGRFIDFNNDRKPDIIITQSDATGNFAPKPIVLFQNDGLGNFSNVTTQMLGPQPPTTIVGDGYAVVDVNNDGLKDFLIGDEGMDNAFGQGAQIKLLIQKPGGVIADETNIRLPQQNEECSSISAGDINGDGYVDFFVSLTGVPAGMPTTQHFLINDSTGKFVIDTTRLPTKFLRYFSPNAAFVDVNKHGHPDLFMSKHDFHEDHDVLLFNDGTGHYTQAPVQSLPPEPLGLGGRPQNPIGTRSFDVMAAADFNGDGWPDLLATISTMHYGTESTLWYLLNNHDGTFSDASDRIPQHWLPEDDALATPVIADFNNDGLMDILVPGSFIYTPPQLYLNKGNGYFIDCSDLIPSDKKYYAMVAGDIDGDGKTDIVMWAGSNYAILKNVKLFDMASIETPSITSLTPSQGPVGTTVTIQGANLAGTNDVQFNGKSTSFQFVSESQINAQVPAGASTGRVQLNTASGVVSSEGNFVVPLVINSFSPLSGVPGQEVLITGSNFTGATAVRFGSVTSTVFSVIADTQIAARVPLSATTGTISITTAGGTFSTTAKFIVLNSPDQWYSLGFNGNQVAGAPLASQLNLGFRYTMEVWIYEDITAPNISFVLGKPHDPIANEPHISYAIQLTDNGKRLDYVQTTDQPFSGVTASAGVNTTGGLLIFPLRTWTHVAATLDSVTMRLYFNGSEVANMPSPGAASNNTIRFALGNGMSKDGLIVTSGLVGALRQVRVWNRTLSPSEIQDNSSKYLTGNEIGLAAYWPLDDSTGQTARDLGPNKLNLTLGTTPGIDNNDPAWITLSGSLAVSGKSVDFGNVVKDSTVQGKVIVTNSSYADVRIDSMYSNTKTFKGLNSGFPVYLKNGDSIAVSIRFHPDSLKQYRDTLFIQNNSIVPLMKIALSGNSPIPTISRSATDLSFGSLAKDSSKSLMVSFTNSSINRLVVDSIHTGTIRFKSDSSRGSIGQSDTLKIFVRFTPVGYGILVDTLYVWNNSVTPLLRIPLSGSSPAPQLAVSTQSLGFGPVSLTDTAIGVVKLHNKSSANRLTISQISNNVPAFTFIANLPMTISASDSAQIAIKFNINSVTPNGYGNWTDTLRITSDGGIASVALIGFSPYPSILISPHALAFGTVKKDSTLQKLFSIQDTSVNSLQVDSLWTMTKHFVVTHSLANRMIKKGDSVLVTMKFTPDSSHQFFDTLYIANNSTISPFKIPLSGNGTLTAVSQFGIDIPKDYMLCQNYPNPFNPSTTIRFGVPMRSRVEVNIFNMLGQRVVQLVNQEVNAGYYEKIWNGYAASGLYFYRLEATTLDDSNKRFVNVKKMILLK